MVQSAISLQVATGLLAVVAVLHLIITVVLTSLVILVRCYCKQKVCPSCSQVGEEIRSKETSTEHEGIAY